MSPYQIVLLVVAGLATIALIIDILTSRRIPTRLQLGAGAVILICLAIFFAS
jgi:hypothetical protein